MSFKPPNFSEYCCNFESHLTGKETEFGVIHCLASGYTPSGDDMNQEG